MPVKGIRNYVDGKDKRLALVQDMNLTNKGGIYFTVSLHLYVKGQALGLFDIHIRYSTVCALSKTLCMSVMHFSYFRANDWLIASK